MLQLKTNFIFLSWFKFLTQNRSELLLNIFEMEHRSIVERIWTPVGDINDQILSWLSMFDLLRCARTCKDFREYFDHKGWLKVGYTNIFVHLIIVFSSVARETCFQVRSRIFS